MASDGSDLGTMDYKCICLTTPGSFTRKLEVGKNVKPGKGYALVKTGFVGVCGTDYHAFGGNQPLFSYPRVLGHELGVTVVALGADCDDAGVNVGDNCAVEPYFHCGKCIACRRGKTNCCTSIEVLGVHIDGGLCSHFLCPVGKLHPSATLPLDVLALVETLCIGAHAVFRGQVEANEWALVVGAGPIGMAASQFAMAEGANVIAIDIDDGRLAFIKEKVGVLHTLNARSPTILDEITAICGGDLPTTVFEATGNIHSMKKSFEFVAHGGKLVFIGHTKLQVEYHNPLFHSREMTIMGSRNALGSDFKRTIKLIEDGKVDVTPWITHRCTYDDFEENFAEWLKPETGVIKAVVSME
jgi:2-desacetyl-2-hydroxyethyl bacteriochlorophyllide A dehydrogenase